MDNDWIYHCTTIDAAENIIKTREFWLSNACCLNDDDEFNRIKNTPYCRSYYVGSFSKSKSISSQHWSDYGKDPNKAILLAVKKEWFSRSIRFINSLGNPIVVSGLKSIGIDDDLFHVYDKNDADLKSINPETHPFYVERCWFQEVIYDDELFMSVYEPSGDGAGIIVDTSKGLRVKKKTGVNRFNGEKRNWESENEVRLIICIPRVGSIEPLIPLFENNNDIETFDRISVKLKEKAFNEIRVWFDSRIESGFKASLLERIQCVCDNSVKLCVDEQAL